MLLLCSCRITLINKNKWESICCLENFLLHSRNIIEFLYFKPDKNYARAIYYLGNDVWATSFSSIPPKINDIIGRANREVTHLTFDRFKVHLLKRIGIGWTVLLSFSHKLNCSWITCLTNIRRLAIEQLNSKVSVYKISTEDRIRRSHLILSPHTKGFL